MPETATRAAPPASADTRVGCRYFYVSRLAPAQPVTVVAELLTLSRSFNRGAGITGALLFDGEHFAQLLEGEAGVVQALARRIEVDARHADIDVRLDRCGGFERLFDRWICGWSAHEELGRLVRDRGADEAAQLERFRRLVAAGETA